MLNDNQCPICKGLGKQVINIHRYNETLKTYKTGILKEVQEGCNGLLGIQWENDDYITWMPPQDINFKDNEPC